MSASDGPINEYYEIVKDAVRRPCKRVSIGKYIDAEQGTFNVYIQVEHEDGRKGKQSKRR